MTDHEWLGPPEHIGFVVPDVEAALGRFGAMGHRFAPVVTPTARIRRPGGEVEETVVRYVTSGGALPHVTLIGEVPGSYWVRDAPGAACHHLTFWVEDLEAATERLAAAGFVADADGLEPDGRLRYRFLRAPDGVRVELGMRAHRDEFEGWAAQAR